MSQILLHKKPKQMPIVGKSRLRYGVNDKTGWREFSSGPHRRQIADCLTAINTEIMRVYVFDRGTLNPVTDWPSFARYVQAVLDVGAKPMITFTRFRPPCSDLANIRWFARRCGELVWNCIEEWGGERVRDWYWCVWDDSNSDWINPGFTFENYREIYLEVAGEIGRCLRPYLDGRRALIGGPSIDTFQPFWLDWLWRFVNEIDSAHIGFVLWHRFGDWRRLGEWGAPRDPIVYRRLLMARTWDYLDFAETVQRLISQHGILNICGKLNTNSHDEMSVSGPLNKSMFGAVFYATALVRLMCGGVDAELYWMATETGPYGLWDDQARPTQAFYSKELIANAIQPGDTFAVHEPACEGSDLLVVEAQGTDSIRKLLMVHLSEESRQYRFGDIVAGYQNHAVVRKLDRQDRGILTTLSDGLISFNGLGVAVATSAMDVLSDIK
jgi:hypothetical protein